MKRLYNPDELSTSDLAAYLGVPHHTIMNWLRWGRIDEPRRLPSRVTGKPWKRVWSRAEARALKRRLRPE